MHGIRLEPFKIEHLTGPDWGAQAWLEPFLDLEQIDNGFSASVFWHEQFVGAGGIHEVHQFRGVAWGIPLAGFSHAFLAMHRLIKRVIAEKLLTYRRIEAYIDPDFPAAIRWAKALGFREECARKPYFFPDGRTGSEWVIIRGD